MRLTDKNHNAVNRCGEYSSCYSCNREKCYISELADKLGEFEDFMEEQEFESLEELKINIEYLKDKIEADKFNYGQLHKFKNHLQQENQALKDRWEKLKDFIDAFKEYNIDEASLAWKILDKMKELEEK